MSGFMFAYYGWDLAMATQSSRREVTMEFIKALIGASQWMKG